MFVMNQNHYQLISLLTAHEKNRYSYHDLSEQLGLGKRSIVNYIGEINEFLAKNHFHTI